MTLIWQSWTWQRLYKLVFFFFQHVCFKNSGESAGLKTGTYIPTLWCLACGSGHMAGVAGKSMILANMSMASSQVAKVWSDHGLLNWNITFHSCFFFCSLKSFAIQLDFMWIQAIICLLHLSHVSFHDAFVCCYVLS